MFSSFISRLLSFRVESTPAFNSKLRFGEDQSFDSDLWRLSGQNFASAPKGFVSGRRRTAFRSLFSYGAKSYEDNRFEDYKLLLKDGSELFETLPVKKLLEHNQDLIVSIREHIRLDDRLYLRYVKPAILTLAKTVFNSPASHVLHDSDCGGLFRHSLLTALLCLDSARRFECFEKILCEDYERLEVFFLILALMHDVGKIISDYEITTPGNRYVFATDAVLENTLEDFARKHKALYLRYHFKAARSKIHDQIFSTLMLQYLNGNPKLTGFLSRVRRPDGSEINLYRELIDFNHKSEFYEVLKAADSRACCASISRFSSLYGAGEYLLSLFLNERIDPALDGFYRLKNGYLVEHGSEAYRALAVAIDLYGEMGQKALSSLSFYEEHDLSETPVVLRDHRQRSYEVSPAFRKKLLGCDYETYAGISSDVLIFKRESFFKKMASTGFLIKKGYISCFNWNEVNLNGEKRYVYGFCINTGSNSGDNCYSLVDLEFDRLIKQLKKSIRVDNTENITSFCFNNGLNLNKVLPHLNDPDYLDRAIDKTSLKFNLYTSIRASERIRQKK
ncbi:TraI domain-containing protein [Succinivibrio dextrinosolvens]|uniref:Helicase n=1 Tax=Succinivibrio dextrinosolvens TaxID=83771 RepID=A0A662Z8S5_9GAMM|nr:TraI domain-containing protein [Succinivibrio dextrinosolvens]SFK03790.1 Putative helicase [Succinivibrio dextrinosolvens]